MSGSEVKVRRGGKALAWLVAHVRKWYRISEEGEKRFFRAHGCTGFAMRAKKDFSRKSAHDYTGAKKDFLSDKHGRRRHSCRKTVF